MQVKKNMTISQETIDYVQALAKKENRSYSNMIETIIKRYEALIEVTITLK